MSSITAETCPGGTLLPASLCLPAYVSCPLHIILTPSHHHTHTHTHTHTHKKNKYTSSELWMNCVTLWWYICHIYTKSFFKELSLFMPPRVHILSLDICGEAHDGPKRWCLTASDTESRLCRHWHRQHLRAWDGAEHKCHIWAQLWGPTEQFFFQRKISVFYQRSRSLRAIHTENNNYNS